MESVNIILAALAAGAGVGAKDTAAQAVKDAYAGLKGLIHHRFADRSDAQLALAEYEQDAETWEKPLQKSLVETGADSDDAILQQAQRVLKLVQPQQAAQGKYNVQIGEGKGVVIGDQAQVMQHFGE